MQGVFNMYKLYKSNLSFFFLIKCSAPMYKVSIQLTIQPGGHFTDSVANKILQPQMDDNNIPHGVCIAANHIYLLIFLLALKEI